MNWAKRRSKRAFHSGRRMLAAVYLFVFVAMVVFFSVLEDRLTGWANKRLDENKEAILDKLLALIASDVFGPAVFGLFAVVLVVTFVLLWRRATLSVAASPPDKAEAGQTTTQRVQHSAAAEAEDIRAATVTLAAGEKEAAILEAEAARQVEILRAEGDQQAKVLRADGDRKALLLRADSGYDALQHLPIEGRKDAILEVHKLTIPWRICYPIFLRNMRSDIVGVIGFNATILWDGSEVHHTTWSAPEAETIDGIALTSDGRAVEAFDILPYSSYTLHIPWDGRQMRQFPPHSPEWTALGSLVVRCKGEDRRVKFDFNTDNYRLSESDWKEWVSQSN